MAVTDDGDVLLVRDGRGYERRDEREWARPDLDGAEAILVLGTGEVAVARRGQLVVLPR